MAVTESVVSSILNSHDVEEHGKYKKVILEEKLENLSENELLSSESVPSSLLKI